MAQTHANLGWIGMSGAKSFKPWDGGGMGGAKIAGIADIARDRRDRKGKCVPPRAVMPHDHRQTYATLGCVA